MQEVMQDIQKKRAIPLDATQATSESQAAPLTHLPPQPTQVDATQNSQAAPAATPLPPKPTALSLGDATEESYYHSFAGDAAADSESDSDSDSDSSEVSDIDQVDGTYESDTPRRRDSRDHAEMPNFPRVTPGDAANDVPSPVAESAVVESAPPMPGYDIDIEKVLKEDKARKAAEKHMRTRDHTRYEQHMQSEEHQRGDEDESHIRSREHRKFMQHAKSHEGESAPSEKLAAPETETSAVNPAVSQASEAPYGSSPATANTTGNPFLRAIPFSKPKTPPVLDDSDSCHDDDHSGRYPAGQHRGQSAAAGKETIQNRCDSATKLSKQSVEVPVGVSRLHLVKLPTLQMMPIYWSPVHDVSAVTRGTWFHKDTMLPVEPTVANQLEKGYREMRPWSQTWKDELNSALEVGAAGEEKISHRLWPKETPAPGKKASPLNHDVSTDPYCAAKCFGGQAAAAGSIDTNQPGVATALYKCVTKRYPNSHVIYKDEKNAFILKTSLQPSAYYGRKPLAKIMKGTTVGLPVVRGFDWALWDKLHPPKKTTSQSTKRNVQEIGIAQSGNADTTPNVCLACRKREQRPKVTDLVLVVHGIGQKLSERVEGFHFTHAVNDFRRLVNVEYSNDAVQHVFREDLGGVMVLPVNWRENVSLDDGPMKDGDRVKEDPNSFGLKDITPDTIPAVRGIISDVMLDIPYYMSRHKPTMLRALVSEANRIYRLWCRNNPSFEMEGRVHLVAHSLGSVMCMEVLSAQPTFVTPGKLDARSYTIPQTIQNTIPTAVHNTIQSTIQSTVPHKIQNKFSQGKLSQGKHFEFNVKNLFLVGSPCGFFLYLDRANLIPRKGRNKPGVEPGDEDATGVASETPRLGSLAIDNIYNVMHPNDPIAYRLNATVDPAHAQSLKIAQVPSSATSILASMGKAVSGFIPGRSAPVNTPVGELAPTKPAMDRLPSQLEMEVHDFSREEIAEKKFHMLNDNGQIDYFLNTGSGPLEYLTMLSAHSSYWTNPDFIRMLVTETGRRPGKEGTLPNMRAVKIGTAARK